MATPGSERGLRPRDGEGHARPGALDRGPRRGFAPARSGGAKLRWGYSHPLRLKYHTGSTAVATISRIASG